MAFQSEFADNAKLNACADNDIDHIGEQFAPKGPWVVLIKKALNAWAAKQRPSVAQIPVNDLFGRETGDLVALYKTRQTPPILNFAGKIDRIVGKKTVVALDKELPRRGGGVTPPAPLTMSALAQRDRLTSIQWAQAAITRLTETRRFLANPPPGPLPGFPLSYRPLSASLSWRWKPIFISAPRRSRGSPTLTKFSRFMAKASQS